MRNLEEGSFTSELGGTIIMDYKTASATLYVDLPKKDVERFNRYCQKMIREHGGARIELPGKEVHIIRKLRTVMAFDYTSSALLRASKTEPGVLRKRRFIDKI